MNAVIVPNEDVPQATSMLQVIERAATNPAVDVDKMERLLVMQEKIYTRQAEERFNAAMNKAQSEISRIAADADNPQTRSKYASYAKLDKVLRPVYTSNGFAISFDTGEAKEGYILMLAYVSHAGGHTRTYRIEMPADGKGAKGGDVMTKTHATGAGSSYGMRYLLKMIWNVAVGEEDTDGNEKAVPTNHGETLTTAQQGYVEEFIVAFRKALDADVEEAMKAGRIHDLMIEAGEDKLVATEAWKHLESKERSALKAYDAMHKKALANDAR